MIVNEIKFEYTYGVIENISISTNKQEILNYNWYDQYFWFKF